VRAAVLRTEVFFVLSLAWKDLQSSDPFGAGLKLDKSATSARLPRACVQSHGLGRYLAPKARPEPDEQQWVAFCGTFSRRCRSPLRATRRELWGQDRVLRITRSVACVVILPFNDVHNNYPPCDSAIEWPETRRACAATYETQGRSEQSLEGAFGESNWCVGSAEPGCTVAWLPVASPAARRGSEQ
jgi:hypothetical protein